MGKATILAHKGDGLYSVRLAKSSRHIVDRLASIETDLQAVEADIQAAAEKIEIDEAALDVRRAAIDEEIGRINAKYAELGATIRQDRDDLKAAENSLRIAQEFLDYLEALEKDDVEVAPQMMAIAKEDVDKKTAERDAVQARLDAHRTEWADRATDLGAIGALVRESAELTESARIARMQLADLVNKRTQLIADRLWLTGKMPADETVDAWCADLTTDLDGVVGTIEAPGERVHQSGALLVRPGYDGGAAYTSAEQFAALITALSAAQIETVRAVERVDAAEAALDANQRRIGALILQLADLIDRPQQTDDEYGYLEDLDGNPIPAPRGITPAEIVFVQGQLDAAQKQTPYLEGSLATMQEALATAREAYDVAAAALDAARAAEAKPRNADGLLQSVAAAPGPFGWFFNQALLPAVEKWRPGYRLGEITALTGDTCTVALDAAKSSQGEIDLNREATLSDVPIRYMECNGAAFDVGDRVVVEFAYHDQTRPTVIGFESHPRECGGDHGICGALAGDDAPTGYTRTKVGSTYYADFQTLRQKSGAWTLGSPPRGSPAATSGARSFGQFDWVYRRDGKVRGYLTWGHPASNSGGLFFTWFKSQCTNRTGDYSWANILPITYDGRSAAAAGAVFLDGRVLAKPAGSLGNRSVAGAAIRHIKPAPTPDNPKPAERKYVLLVIDQSVIPALGEDRYGVTATFGAAFYAVDVTDGPVDTNERWATNARLIYQVGQISVTRPSVGNTAYGGVDRFTTFGSRGVRFRFNGSATRASAVVHAQCQLGYDRNGDARWHDWGETPIVVHVDIAADLSCAHTVEDPVVGAYSFSGSRWQTKSSGWGTIPPGGVTPPPEVVGEANYTGSGSVGATTLMIDYVGDVEKRVTATDRLDYSHHQTFIAWANSVFDIALTHEITTQVGRHTITERRLDRRPLGDIGSTEYSGAKTERFQFLAVDPRYDFYAGLRMIYETTDADPSSPDLPDGARVVFELEVNGQVIERSEIPALWFGSTTWAPKWDTGGMYNYINATIGVDDAFNTMNGTTTRAGAYCLRPIRRATFRICEPFKWYLDAGIDPDWLAKVQTTPVIDFIPYALCLTDVGADEANPKTLFVTNCPTLSATTLSGKKSDGWGLLAQHQWVCLMIDANGARVDMSQVFGKPESVHPRFCGAGLV
jgi:hypothetical protein